jgi:hypothetical protein
MDRKYIQNEHIVDRYLSGELTVLEARAFEKYCLEHPDFLNELPIPVRLKARLARRPATDSETGVFKAIPSKATHTALEVGEEGFDAEEEKFEWRRTSRGGGVSKLVVIGLAAALIAAIAGVIVYAKQASQLSAKLASVQKETQSQRMQPPGSVQTLRLQLSRAKPEQPTTTIGWTLPPQLLDIYIDATEAKYNTFQITIDKVDEGRLMQLSRVARDSNRDVRFKLNSSAFGRGELLMKVDGYTWRGEAQEIGWLRLDMR